MKNVIVTGANGFLGSSLIKKLITYDVQVVAIDISFADLHLPESNQITRIEVGLDEKGKIEAALPKNEYEVFYHFAWAGVNGSAKADPIVQLKNTEMALNCAMVAHEIGCKKMLCAGTVAEEAVKSLENLDEVSGGLMYGVAKHCTHLMLETYCKNVGLDFIWMRFSNIYGPANKTGNLISYTIAELQKGLEATFGPAMQPYDFIYVDDLIEAVLRLGICPTKKDCYFIGSGEPRLLKDYLLEIGKIYGREDLIKIGVRPDDGIRYEFDMFSTKQLKADIGNYVSKSFSEGIKYTLEVNQ